MGPDCKGKWLQNLILMRRAQMILWTEAGMFNRKVPRRRLTFGAGAFARGARQETEMARQ